jgi:membrane protease YdiL (CAAX protease family)
MKPSDIFLNDAGRLRSGWRFAIYFAVFIVFSAIFETALKFLQLESRSAAGFLESNWGFIAQSAMLFSAAFLAGWGCLALFEGLPVRALGWAMHRGWVRDWLLGSLTGIASLMVAVVIAAAMGVLHFTLNPAGTYTAVLSTIVVSCLVFICAAAGEEMVFRGYPLQTMARSHIAWVAITVTAIFFAMVHLNNPNVEGWGFLQTAAGGAFRKIGWGFMNTMLAGIWLSVAYLRTRSLWFPLGVHWSWNWMMGAILGLPVSGIEDLTPHPLLHATDAGPSWAWLTGGAYGIEGGAACTIALLLSTLFIWRTRLLAPTPEMLELTDKENPKEAPLKIYDQPAINHQPPASSES